MLNIDLAGTWPNLVTCFDIVMNTSNIDTEIYVVKSFNVSRSQWPRDLRLSVYGRSFAGIAGSDHPGSMDACLLWVLYVVRYRGLCVELITRPEESYRVWCFWEWAWNIVNKALAYQRMPCRKTNISLMLSRGENNIFAAFFYFRLQIYNNE
jgi:hypothetical protein